MLDSYLSEIDFPAGARVLEIGCGTGAVTRVLAAWPGVTEAVGIDPSPVFISTARELATAAGNVTFEGFDVLGSRSHGYMQTSDPEYMLTLVDRGADTLASWGASAQMFAGR